MQRKLRRIIPAAGLASIIAAGIAVSSADSATKPFSMAAFAKQCASFGGTTIAATPTDGKCESGVAPFTLAQAAAAQASCVKTGHQFGYFGVPHPTFPSLTSSHNPVFQYYVCQVVV